LSFVQLEGFATISHDPMRPKSKGPSPYPQAHLVVQTKDGISRIFFQQKYGVWFWISCEKPFRWYEVESWGFTRLGIEHQLKQLGLNFDWVEK